MPASETPPAGTDGAPQDPTNGSENRSHHSGSVDLATCTVDQLSYFLAGVMHGAHSQAATDDARRDALAARLHHRAHAVVQMMARIPERDAEADRAAKARRDARWSA